MSDDITPIRKQYLEIKRQYPNTLLFFRLGDFYETFDEDAEIVARELDIALTSRPVGKGQRAPLAGIPYHAVENYLARLIERGYHVAICEQIGDQPIKGLVPRRVVRVITPGTVIEQNLLPSGANNYLACVFVEESRAALAYADITTGEFAVTEMEAGPALATLRAELTRLQPAETLHPDTLRLEENGLPGHLTSWPSWRFESGRCQQVLLEHFQTLTLDGFGLRERSLAIRAAGALLQYVRETEPGALELLKGLRYYHLGEFMVLDAATRRNLELTESLRPNRRGETHGSLLGVLDRTITPMGKRLLRRWIGQPLLNVERIRARQESVQRFFDNGLLRAELRTALRPIGDLERLTTRLLAGHAQPRDLVALRESLRHLPNVLTILGGTHPHLHACQEEYALLQDAIAEDPPATLQNIGIIRPGYSAELDEVVGASQHARDWIANLEQKERERTG
ncbi:MAG: DNA mismatch repair protein MutS, partial [Anaerolineales bacterium]